ncbi:MAG: leucine-rich repeat domain-containing protein [Oscillospiraceae bacterium]
MVNKNFSFTKNIIIIIIASLLALGAGGTAVVLGISNIPANRVSRYMGAAERYLSEMNYEQAVIEFQRVLEIEPMNVDAYLGLADAYVGLDDTKKALEILHEGFKRTEDERLRKCINEITIPSSSNDIESDSSSSQTVSESAVDSIGSVTILGEEYDIATTTHLFLVDVGITDDILKQIVPEIEQLINLTDLFLFGNQISDVTPLAELTCLQGLELGNNQISDITPLTRLTNLQHLYLRDNQISDTMPLARLMNLWDLDLGGNQISDITSLTGLTNLQDLDLTGNQIAETDKQWIRTQLPNCDIYG